MKKFKLKPVILEGAEMLTRAQMKNLAGGFGVCLPELSACSVNTECCGGLCLLGICIVDPNGGGGGGVGGYCNTRRECSTGCATYTDATMQHGVCDNCCLA